MTSALRNPMRNKRARARLLSPGEIVVLFFGAPISPFFSPGHTTWFSRLPAVSRSGLEPRLQYSSRQYTHTRPLRAAERPRLYSLPALNRRPSSCKHTSFHFPLFHHQKTANATRPLRSVCTLYCCLQIRVRVPTRRSGHHFREIEDRNRRKKI
jgi:hypothetical protein